MKKKILTEAGTVLMLTALVLSLTVAAPLRGERTVRFASTYKENEVTLEASIYETEGAEYGVLICPGYSCDRQKLSAAAGLFVENGMTVMTFDYAGQGAGSGTIGFDNAKTDAITQEIADAMEVFHDETGISYEKMILVGHSMGGRAILRLLYDYHSADAVTNVEKRDLGYAILMAPEVNYTYNSQASLFAGTSDAGEEPWASYSESWTEGTDIWLFGSTGDDVVRDEDIWAIYSHLGGDPSRTSGTGSDSCVNGTGSRISVSVVSGVLHSFQFYSVKFAEMLNSACEDITGEEASYPAGRFLCVYASWILICIGAVMVTAGLSSGLEWEKGSEVPEITDMKLFLGRKLLMWIPGIIMAFLVCCLCVICPWGSPIMNVPYMCFIAGYGITMLLAYRRGRFPGCGGKLPRPVLTCENRGRTAVTALAASALITFAGWLCLRCTAFRLFPLNFRLPWLFFASLLMAVGYYVSGVEEDMMEKAHAGRRERILYAVIGHVPLFLFVGFYLIIGSYSGTVQQLINVVLMYAVFAPVGNYLKKALQNRLYGALLTAFLFQGFMLTSASLIAMF